MSAQFNYGDKVLLIDGKQRRYLITLAEGAEFHSHAGFVSHSEIAGRPEGGRVQSTKGARYIALRPTLEDFVVEMPRALRSSIRKISHPSACWPTSVRVCGCSRVAWGPGRCR